MGEGVGVIAAVGVGLLGISEGVGVGVEEVRFCWEGVVTIRT